jgi:hypothetical protein
MRILAVFSPASAFAGLGVFVVDNFLRFDGHVYHIGGFGLEPAFCED